MTLIILYTNNFNSPIKASLSNKKYYIKIQTRTTQIEIISFRKTVFNGSLKVIGYNINYTSVLVQLRCVTRF